MMSLEVRASSIFGGTIGWREREADIRRVFYPKTTRNRAKLDLNAKDRSEKFHFHVNVVAKKAETGEKHS